MSFANNEKNRYELIVDKDLFKHDGGWGSYKYKGNLIKKKHVLKNYEHNLYEKPDDFKWHTGKASTLSSQVACVNHLFPIRQNRDAILAILNNIEKGITFEEVMPIYKPDGNVFVDFERSDPKLMNESTPTRIDALILAKKDKNSKDTTLVVIEWKYTESHTRREDKSIEDRKDSKGKVIKEGSGKDRMKRYNRLIQKSLSLRRLCEEGLADEEYDVAEKYKRSVYYQEPFYELMRQTLWAELVTGRIDIEKKRRNNEKGIPSEASDYLHLCVVPKKNKELLDMMEKTWMEMLTDEGQKRFMIKDPEDLFKPLKDVEKFSYLEDLCNYLKTRYWENEIDKNFEDIVADTEAKLVSRAPDWSDTFKKYGKNILETFNDYKEKGEKIKDAIEELKIPEEIQLYSSVSKVRKSTKRTAYYELRFCGQRICGVKNLDEPVIYFEKDDKKKNMSYFKIKETIMKEMPLKEAKYFFKNFTVNDTKDKSKSNPAENVKSREHKLESLILREMAKGKGEGKRIEFIIDIEPVKLGAGFFQMPTPVKASTHVPEISIRTKDKSATGGNIDILARAYNVENEEWIPAVIELKDENNPEEPEEAVMTQALIYATFLGHLLADKECGDAWYKIISGDVEENQCTIPSPIKILVVVMMPKKYGEPDEIYKKNIELKVKDKEGKEIELIPCVCYIETNQEITELKKIEWVEKGNK